jgi:hypothetical protein
MRVGSRVFEVFAGHLDQIDRRRSERDLFAGFQRFHIAARLQADIAFAEQTAGEDAGRGVDRQILVALVDVEHDHGVELLRIQFDRSDLADGDAADLHRRHRPQLTEIGESRLERIGAVAEAEFAVGGGDGQDQQRGERQ